MAYEKKPKKPKVMKKKITRCNALIVENLNGENIVNIIAKDDGGGIWIKGKDGNQIAIFDVDGQMAIGFYSKSRLEQHSDKPQFMSVALSHSKNEGRPILQYANDSDEHPSFVYLDELATNRDLAIKVEALEKKLESFLAGHVRST